MFNIVGIHTYVVWGIQIEFYGYLKLFYAFNYRDTGYLCENFNGYGNIATPSK